MKKIVNLTPHSVNLNTGESFPSAGLARVGSSYTPFQDGVCGVTFGEIQGLPAPEEGTLFVVSALVAQAAKRADVVSPATGHPECVRNDQGQIVSVPGFVTVL